MGYLPEIATRLDTQMSSAKNVEELVITATNFEKANSTQQRGRSPGRTGYQSPGGTKYRQRGKSADRTSYQSPGGTSYKIRGKSNNRTGFTSPGGTRYQQRGRSNNNRTGFTSPGGTQYRQRGRSPKRAAFTSPGGRSYRPRSTSAGRYQSPGGRRYNRSPGGTMWRKSSAPRNPTQQQNCVRCGDPHPSVECPHYAYYRGTPCSECNLQHATTSHKKRRSGSSNRNNQQVGGVIQHNQTEIVQTTEVPIDNLNNYFATKN